MQGGRKLHDPQREGRRKQSDSKYSNLKAPERKARLVDALYEKSTNGRHRPPMRGSFLLICAKRSYADHTLKREKKKKKEENRKDGGEVADGRRKKVCKESVDPKDVSSRTSARPEKKGGRNKADSSRIPPKGGEGKRKSRQFDNEKKDLLRKGQRGEEGGGGWRSST